MIMSKSSEVTGQGRTTSNSWLLRGVLTQIQLPRMAAQFMFRKRNWYYTLLKKRQPYIDPDTDYEGFMVRKNASRWLHKLEEYGYLRQVQQQA